MDDIIFTDEELAEFKRLESSVNDEDKVWLNRSQKELYVTHMRYHTKNTNRKNKAEIELSDLKNKRNNLKQIIDSVGYSVEKELRLTKDNQEDLESIKKIIDNTLIDRIDINPFFVDSGTMNTENNLSLITNEQLHNYLTNIFNNLFPKGRLDNTYFNYLGRFDSGKFIINFNSENSYINAYESVFESLPEIVYNIYDKAYREIRKDKEEVDYNKILNTLSSSYIIFENIFQYFYHLYYKRHSKVLELKQKELKEKESRELTTVELKILFQQVSKELEATNEFQVLNYYNKLRTILKNMKNEIQVYLQHKAFFTEFLPMYNKLIDKGYGSNETDLPKDELYNIEQEKIIKILLEHTNFDKNMLFLLKSLTLSRDITVNEIIVSKNTTIYGISAQIINDWLKQLKINTQAQVDIDTIKKLLKSLLPENIPIEEFEKYVQEVKLLFSRNISRLSQNLIATLLLEIQKAEKLPVSLIQICVIMQILGNFFTISSSEKIINIAELIKRMTANLDTKLTPFTIGRMDRIKKILEQNPLNIDDLAQKRTLKFTFNIPGEAKTMTLLEISQIIHNIEREIKDISENISNLKVNIMQAEKAMLKIINKNKAKMGLEALNESIKTHVGYVIPKR